MNTKDRQRVIRSLFDHLTTSSFAEGCEPKIARGLEARTDEQLLTFAKEKGTWIPLDEVLTYKISEDGKSITCLGCGLTSFHPRDVREHYCGQCHIFHDDLWPPSREWWIENTRKVNAGVVKAIDGVYFRPRK